jgi:hypothetical protein
MKIREANHVDVECVLANGGTYTQSWSSPVSFGRLLGKGARWMREQLRRENVRGRSQIVSMRVEVRRTGKAWKRK